MAMQAASSFSRETGVPDDGDNGSTADELDGDALGAGTGALDNGDALRVASGILEGDDVGATLG